MYWLPVTSKIMSMETKPLKVEPILSKLANNNSSNNKSANEPPGSA